MTTLRNLILENGSTGCVCEHSGSEYYGNSAEWIREDELWDLAGTEMSSIDVTVDATAVAAYLSVCTGTFPSPTRLHASEWIDHGDQLIHGKGAKFRFLF